MTDPAALPPYGLPPQGPGAGITDAAGYRPQSGSGYVTGSEDPADATFWQRWAPAGDLRAGLAIVLTLAVLGALLGLVWQWWSPPTGLGFVVAKHEIQPDETEAFVAADGRFAVIVAVVGVAAGLLAWRRTAVRGPVVAAALALGGFAGALLTALVGHLVAGGTDGGKPGAIIGRLPLSVHMRGLLLLEAIAAVMVYSICASFATRDDLGRDEPSPSAPRQSVGVGGQA